MITSGGNESNISANGAKDVKKHKKNTDDNRESVTFLYTGVSGGAEGPHIYLAKKKS